MTTFRALSRGTQIVLVAGPLVVASLFFTWQRVEVDYGQAGVATMSLDGFDAWGLLLALLAASTTTLVVLGRLTPVELPEDVSWDTVTLALGSATAAVAVVKNLTDADSSWASYGFLVLALAVGLGTYLEWAAARRSREPALTSKRRGFRPTA
jgi:hypothetical protein